MYYHDYKIRVRYADTDQMGFVYYGKYATFYEIGRVEAIRNLGVSYRELEDSGVIMPVLECRSKFIRPARYDELLTIRTIIPEEPKVRILFRYEIKNEGDKLIHIGETTLVFLDQQTMRPVRLPQLIANHLRPFFS